MGRCIDANVSQKTIDVLDLKSVSSLQCSHMEKTQFLDLTDIDSNTFDRLSSSDRLELFAACDRAIEHASNHEEAKILAAEAVARVTKEWRECIKHLSYYVVPPGETESVASLENRLKRLKQRVGLSDSPQSVPV